MDLEASMINFVKELSLEEHRSNSDYTFKEISIAVETIKNDGNIKVGNRIICNACFFISLKDGLIQNGFETFTFKNNKLKITPFNLMFLGNYRDFNQCFDTNNQNHIDCLNKIVRFFNDIKIQLYIGSYDYENGIWKTVPDNLSQCYGSGEKNIRILNKGFHFEYIITQDKDFIYKPRTMNIEKVMSYQKEMFKSYQ